jgi:hypothetical protein
MKMPAMLSEGPDDPTGALSPSEIVEEIQSLTVIERTKLTKVAAAYARRTPYGYEDLLQEMKLRVLAGARVWRRGVDRVGFLAGVMRSIAWEWKERSPDWMPNGPDIEAEERRAIARLDLLKTIAVYKSLFKDDPVAQKMIVAIIDGIKGEELRILSGLSKTEYDSKRTKIRRRLENLSR